MGTRGWRFSADQVQFKNTLVIDLRHPEDRLLENMKPKTRYNIRLAEKKGVSIRAGTSADVSLLYRMFAQTSARDGFVIRDEAYYQGLWRGFLATGPRTAESPWCEPLVAEVDGSVVAGIIIFYFGKRAYYLYGMSTGVHRERMPNHLLQWEAIRRAKANGCEAYDLWGAPDNFRESDRLWGVYRFKEGFGGQVVVTLGAWDFPPRILWYTLYGVVASRFSAWSRLKGNRRTRQLLQD
jgi:lipid II:glycine glycyltransferase (peptidoglycan interpeptide bridge formation enzyme)